MSATMGGSQLLVLLLGLFLARSYGVLAMEVGSNGVTADDIHRHQFPLAQNSFIWNVPDPRSRRIGPSQAIIPLFKDSPEFESTAGQVDLSSSGDAEKSDEPVYILGGGNHPTIAEQAPPEVFKAESEKVASAEATGRYLEEYSRGSGYTNLAQAPAVVAELYKGPVRGESPPNPVGTRTTNLLNTNAPTPKPTSTDVARDPERQSASCNQTGQRDSGKKP